MKMFNIRDFLVIGVMAFVFIFAANYGLKKAGLSQFQTSQ